MSEERSGFSGEVGSAELSLSVGGMSYSLATESFELNSAVAELYARTFSYSGHSRSPAIVRAYYVGNRLAVRTGFWGVNKLFVERRLELLVDLYLIAGHHLVGFVGHADHRL